MTRSSAPTPPLKSGLGGSPSLAVVLVVGLLALAGMTPLAGVLAEDGPMPAGMIIQATDPDVAMDYSSSTSAAVCFIDLDGTGGYSSDDGVIMTLQGSCSGTSSGSDLAMASWSTQEAGKRLSIHRNIELESLTPEPRFWYHDADDSDRPSTGDVVYLRMREAENGLVRVNDVRITPYEDFPAGSKVASGDSDLSRSVSLLGTPNDIVRHVDLFNTNTLMPPDLLYLGLDSTRDVAGAGDLRIYSGNSGMTYGQILDYGDPDAKFTIAPVSRPLCFVDRSETGGYTIGDTLYLSLRTQCTGTVRTGDIRLNIGSDGEAGSRVSSGDPDHGTSYSHLPNARVGYIDSDGNGRLTSGEHVYLNIFSPGENRVDAGDILLTPSELGQGVSIESDHDQVGSTLQNLGPFADLIVFPPWQGASSPGTPDPVYLSPDSNHGQGLRPGDIRLVQVGNHSFGGPVGLETSEVLPTITRGSASVCSVDDSPGSSDPVYLRMDGSCPSNVQSGMVRLKAAGGQEAFTVVRSGDSDAGTGITGVSGTMEFKFFPDTGDWGPGDTLYLDLRSIGDDRVNVGDIRLTPFGDLPGGSAVQSSDNDNNMPLSTLGPVNQFAGYVDVDHDNEFGTRDHAYITPTTGQTHTSTLSVRMTPIPAAFNPPEIPEEPVDPDPSPTEDSTPNSTESPTSPTTDTDPEATDEESTPGPAVAAILAVLVAVVAWRRSRR